MVNEYRDYKRFYNEQAYRVQDFCAKNRIECYIKEKTITGIKEGVITD